MKILVSNDDGYQAAGIKSLIIELKKISDVIVVAPDRNRSGVYGPTTHLRCQTARKVSPPSLSRTQ